MRLLPFWAQVQKRAYDQNLNEPSASSDCNDKQTQCGFLKKQKDCAMTIEFSKVKSKDEEDVLVDDAESEQFDDDDS